MTPRFVFFSLALLLSSALTAQSLKELRSMVDKIQKEEKVALTAFTEDNALYRELSSLTTDAQAMPYPQMKVLIDSMQLNLDSLQQVRRRYSSTLTSIEPKANAKGKFKGEPEAASQAAALKRTFRSDYADILVWEQDISRFHEQFSNLVKLHKIQVFDYAEYTRQFTGLVESYENKMVEQGKVIGSLKADMAKNKATLSASDAANRQARIDELSSIHSTTESYITQVRNFQDRFSTTVPDEMIYIAPSVPMPYMVQIMHQELARLDENLRAFDLIAAEP